MEPEHAQKERLPRSHRPRDSMFAFMTIRRATACLAILRSTLTLQKPAAMTKRGKHPWSLTGGKPHRIGSVSIAGKDINSLRWRWRPVRGR